MFELFEIRCNTITTTTITTTTTLDLSCVILKLYKLCRFSRTGICHFCDGNLPFFHIFAEVDHATKFDITAANDVWNFRGYVKCSIM